MTKTLILFLSVAVATVLQAQQKKPADPKKEPAHSPEQSALNRVKQDERAKEILKKTKAVLDKELRKQDAARKEVERLEKSKTVPSKDEAKATLEKIKEGADKNGLKELENSVRDTLRESKEVLEAEAKKAKEAMRERNAKEGDTPPAPAPEELNQLPGNFDNITAADPLPIRKSPVFQTAPLSADMMVSGMRRDPKNPDVELPASDPRTRTFVLTGTARLRRADFVLDADNVSVLFKEGQAPGSGGALKSNKASNADPIKAGKKNSPIERIVAQGRVRFMFVDKTGHVQAGRCGHLIYEDRTGWFILKDWPEAEAEEYLLRGPTKESVIRLSRTEKAEADGCELLTLDRELTIADVPKDQATPVPPARPVRSATSAPSPAPR
ncbi:MAG TPA: hypothetical protein VG796_12680 [Verrucomicrobiales bacterium]|nr:hypothetical protein [Verrucomicrobiales bacterium]